MPFSGGENKVFLFCIKQPKTQNQKKNKTKNKKK